MNLQGCFYKTAEIKDRTGRFMFMKTEKKGQKVRRRQTDVVFIIRPLTRTELSLWCYAPFCASLKRPKIKSNRIKKEIIQINQ